MNRRFATILVCAFVIAAVCSYGVYRVAALQMSKHIVSTRLVVATRDLPTGTLIKDSDLAFTTWMGVAPKGAIVARSTVVGRGVITPLYQGEPILDSRLAAVGSGAGLAAIIRPGMRACAVKVDEVVGVAGFVVPGQRVDVLIDGMAPGTPPSQGPQVRTLLQNIEVLSAGTDIQRDGEGKPVQVQVVNLLVTPEQAELLSLASNVTRIQLVLRNPLDTDVPKAPSLAMASLFSDGTAKPAPPVRPTVARVVVPKPPAVRVYLVQVINGAKKTEEKFAAPSGATEQQQLEQQK